MKQLFLFVCCIFFTASALLAQPITPPYIRIGGFFNTSTNQVEGGTTYTHNQTVWVDCGTSVSFP
ncbi:hypothetical protein [Dyadobacter alkalitolerans]|uniref:hypothetical protein n=1 Tax=Dyadobacter alkalitolerans TaxID=492736 RepID=UPI0012FCB418|nr:hypothetical protein [Dyadobacter alkalitolerans]